MLSLSSALGFIHTRPTKHPGSFWTTGGKKTECEALCPSAGCFSPDAHPRHRHSSPCFYFLGKHCFQRYQSCFGFCSTRSSRRSITAGRHLTDPWRHGATGRTARGGCSGGVRTLQVLSHLRRAAFRAPGLARGRCLQSTAKKKKTQLHKLKFLA